MPDRTSGSSRHGHSHRHSDTSRTTRSRRSSSAVVPPSPSRAPPPPVPSASASRRPSAVARDSAQSNFDSSVFSRSSISTNFTTDSRVTSLSSPQYPQPTASYRDSFISIVDDPFFQRFDPAFSAHAPPATRLSSDSEAGDADDDQDEDDEDDEPDSDEQQASPTAQAAGGHDPKSDRNWPPPRRESLTIGPAQYWVGASETLFRPCLAADQTPCTPRSMTSNLPVCLSHDRLLTSAASSHRPILPPWRASISP